MRLKSRNAFAPGGFQFTQPETGWNAPKWQSFDVVVKELIKHRKGNPHLVKKHDWSLDYDTVANEIDEYNAVRCRNAGYFDFIAQDSPPSPKLFLSRFQAQKPAAAAAGSMKRVAAGIGALYEWLGSGANPVSKEKAESRAGTCVTCPMNGKGDWTRFFTGPAVEMIKKQLAIKHDLRLETSHDAELGVCEACMCQLTLKPWVPLETILHHTNDDMKKRLHPKCWILSESKQ